MARFPYTNAVNTPDSLMPRLSLMLNLGDQSVAIVGLVDSGASVNVLPYSVGLQLGAVWTEQRLTIPLVGSLGRFEARGLALLASHPQLTPTNPVRLVFAWTRSDEAPLLLGQTNFFMEFDVFFYGSVNMFDVNLKQNRLND
ncbi:MAG: retroviral-like aspartic protease [Anaerolineae bacterium]